MNLINSPSDLIDRVNLIKNKDIKRMFIQNILNRVKPIKSTEGIYIYKHVGLLLLNRYFMTGNDYHRFRDELNKILNDEL